MKTINLELSKRLAPYLENIETQKYTDWNFTFYWRTLEHQFKLWTENKNNYYKTLTLEEAIEFLPERISGWDLELAMNKTRVAYVMLWDCSPNEMVNYYSWKTLLQAIEKMLEYLLNNDLLWKQATV